MNPNPRIRPLAPRRRMLSSIRSGIQAEAANAPMASPITRVRGVKASPGLAGPVSHSQVQVGPAISARSLATNSGIRVLRSAKALQCSGPGGRMNGGGRCRSSPSGPAASIKERENGTIKLRETVQSAIFIARAFQNVPVLVHPSTSKAPPFQTG